MRSMLFTLLLALSFAAPAAPPYEYATVPGATCKTAGVTPSTQLDVRAIGARNLSTSAGVFVVCPFALTPTPIEGGVVTELNLTTATLDGKAHSIACTAVIGSLVRYVPPVYSTKTIDVGPSEVTITWTASDFGGAGSGIQGSAWATITCNVPPQTSINLLYAKLNPAIQ